MSGLRVAAPNLLVEAVYFFENFEVKLAAGASNLGLKLTLPPTVA